MRTLKGPGIFLAQFVDDGAPFDTLAGLAEWVAGLGFVAVQIPTWDARIFDVEEAAESQDYCDEVRGILGAHGLVLTELCSHLHGQLVAAHPAYDQALDHVAPPRLRGRPDGRRDWSIHILQCCARASARLGLGAHVSFPGNLVWPYMYPGGWRPAGIVEDGFAELGRRWRPLLDIFEENGVDLAFEVHAAQDIHDGLTFERFRAAVGEHQRCTMLFDPSHFVLQQLDYLAFIDIYFPFIKVVHIKDAEFRPTGKQGIYGSYEPWAGRAARFRSLGDGQVDFLGIFSKLTQYGFDGWATLEWECCLKDPEQGAREGAAFIRDHIIEVARRSFASEAGTMPDRRLNARDMGLAGDANGPQRNAL